MVRTGTGSCTALRDAASLCPPCIGQPPMRRSPVVPARCRPVLRVARESSPKPLAWTLRSLYAGGGGSDGGYHGGAVGCGFWSPCTNCTRVENIAAPLQCCSTQKILHQQPAETDRRSIAASTIPGPYPLTRARHDARRRFGRPAAGKGIAPPLALTRFSIAAVFDGLATPAPRSRASPTLSHPADVAIARPNPEGRRHRPGHLRQRGGDAPPARLRVA